MKKILLIIPLIVLLALGCKKNFDPELYGTLSPVNFPSTESEYELYTLEVYKPFEAKWGYSELAWQNNFYSYEYGYVQLFDAPTDLFTVFPEWGGFFEAFSKANFAFLKTQDRSSHFEKVRFVSRITKIIDDLEKSNIRQISKTELIAEARMARGWMMYYLLHMYGPVPVILDASLLGTNAEADLTRPSREDFSNSIIEDLSYAAENLPVHQQEYGRFTKGIAYTILMRHYMNEKDFVKAEATGREITKLGYALVPDYASLFREATEVNSETIYAVSCENGQSGGVEQNSMNAFAFYCYPSDYPGNKVQGGWPSPNGTYMATWQFYDSFDSADTRRDLLIPGYVNKNGEIRDRSNMRGALIAKYPDEGGDVNSMQGNDVVIARYAGVLLLLAEAINENNNGPTAEAIALVDSVRTRAGIKSLEEAGIDISTREAFNDVILSERGKELYFEGVRKMDLVRHGKWESALQSVGKTPGPYLFPIPDYAINNSNGKLIQNDGY